MDSSETSAPKPLQWVTSSRSDLRKFPEQVRREIGYALHLAQAGETPFNAKPLKGFGGASVLEIVASHAGDAFRTVYTVKFSRAIYVLHAFQKKSKKGVATPQSEINLIRQRLAIAVEHYQQTYGTNR